MTVQSLWQTVSKLLKDEDGSAEIIGLALILLFVVLAVSGRIKNLGATMDSGISSLDQDMQNALQ
jgi:Flp pilus assembly pilin Flp